MGTLDRQAGGAARIGPPPPARLSSPARDERIPSTEGAGARREDAGTEPHRRRRERRRVEILCMLHAATDGRSEVETDVWRLARNLGVRYGELFPEVEWLERRSLVRWCGNGLRVCLTPEGAELMRRVEQER